MVPNRRPKGCQKMGNARADGALAGVFALPKVTNRWCQAGLGGHGDGTIYLSATVTDVVLRRWGSVAATNLGLAILSALLCEGALQASTHS